MSEIRGREKFSKYKRIINIGVIIFGLFPLPIRIKLFESIRMTNGLRGLVFRYILLKTISAKVGDNVSIHPNVLMFSADKLSIGNNVSIHPMCYIDATGGVDIGNDVSIAHGVTIMSTTHKFSSSDLPIKDQGIELMKTELMDNVWIGAKATILSGVTINSGSIVGANSLVAHDVQQNTIVGGVPARIIKER